MRYSSNSFLTTTIGRGLMGKMRIEHEGDDGSPAWIWRSSGYGKLSIDEVALIALVIDENKVPTALVDCFVLNLPVLMATIEALPWGPKLWSEVYKYAETIVDATLFQPSKANLN